jgi:hypothetical protein
MTSAVQLGIQRIEAMDKLNQHMREIADIVSVTPVDMPVQSKYGADYLVVRQLEAMGQWAEALKVALAPVANRAFIETDSGLETSADPTPVKRGRKPKVE